MLLFNLSTIRYYGHTDYQPIGAFPASLVYIANRNTIPPKTDKDLISHYNNDWTTYYPRLLIINEFHPLFNYDLVAIDF